MLTQHSQPLGVARDLVEFIAMHPQIAFAVGRNVNWIVRDNDSAKTNADMRVERFVMVPGHHCHLHAMPCAFQNC